MDEGRGVVDEKERRSRKLREGVAMICEKKGFKKKWLWL